MLFSHCFLHPVDAFRVKFIGVSFFWTTLFLFSVQPVFAQTRNIARPTSAIVETRTAIPAKSALPSEATGIETRGREDSTGIASIEESEALIDKMFEPEILQDKQTFSDPEREKSQKSQRNKKLLENISIGGDVKVLGYMGKGIGPGDQSGLRSRARIEAIYQANDNVSVGTTVEGNR
jgi:hypothetical protein